MSVKLIDYAILSKATYNTSDVEEHKIPQGWLELEGYRTTDPETGFQATVYQDNEGNVVISYRGTDELKDVMEDVNIAFGNTDQYRVAAQLYDNVFSEFGSETISLTGHSLGGALAQLVAISKEKEAVGFNSPGVESIIPSVLKIESNQVPESFPNITNINMYADTISSWGNQLGNVINYHASTPEVLKLIVGGVAIGTGAGAVPWLGAAIFASELNNQHEMDRLIQAMTEQVNPNEISGWKYEDGSWSFYHQFLDEYFYPDAAQLEELTKLQQQILSSNEQVEFNLQRVKDTYGTESNVFIEAIDSLLSFLINPAVSGELANTRAAVQRRDPLILDLDGDGLETLGINSDNPILFDHDADGVKTATGWIKPDDGFLVLDRNQNGMIDDGTELFGDSTPIHDDEGNVIGKAEDGFDALVQQDSNNDGLVNADDVNWQDLRVWQDINGNGVSEQDELKTLDAAGIAGLHVAKTENSQPLSDGNLLADLGSYIRTDGSESGLGNVSAKLGDIDLIENTFYSNFTDEVIITEQAANLPDMHGSGRVRNLRESMSLSDELADVIKQYSVAPTRDAQIAMLDEILVAWGSTSDLLVTGAGAYEGIEANFIVAGVQEGSSDHQAWLSKLQTLERFDGKAFADPSENDESVTINLFAARKTFINNAWSALRQSVYDGLLLQTRLKPYVDAIALISVDTGIGVDFNAVTEAFESHYESNPAEAVRDLLDWQRITGMNTSQLGWDGYDQLQSWLSDAVTSPNLDSIQRSALLASLVSAINDFGYSGLAVNGDGNSQNDVVINHQSSNELSGHAGDDLLLGDAADNLLNGGSGSDILAGGNGNDTYVFNLGNANDLIMEAYGENTNDQLHLGEDISIGDLNIYQQDDKLVFSHINNKDQISVANWFNSLSDAAHQLDTLSLASGEDFSLQRLQLGTSEADVLNGNNDEDFLVAGEGDDSLTGDAGNDVLYGGSGQDIMTGGSGDDLYVVDNQNDQVIENASEGIDRVESRISYLLSENVENLTLVGKSNINGTGNTLDNEITGNSGSNILYGDKGKDTLLGHDGNDLLDGGIGKDILLGGKGNDLLYGGNGQDLLMGNEGDDLLNGGHGKDTLLGGMGNDSYTIDHADIIIESIDQGNDSIYSDFSYTLQENIENLHLIGDSSINGAGNSHNNVITGNAANNLLKGLEGNDYLNGSMGDDVISGGSGNDNLSGGKGADLLIGGLDNDSYFFNIGDGVDRIQDNQGVNRVVFGSDLTSNDIDIARSNDDVIVSFKGTDDHVVLEQWYKQTQSEGINRIEFSNGSYLDRSGIELLANSSSVINTDLLSVNENILADADFGLQSSTESSADTSLTMSLYDVADSNIDAIVSFWDSQQENDYLDDENVDSLNTSTVEDTLNVLAQWIAMDLAISKSLLEEGSWLSDDLGADITVLNASSGGYSGSTVLSGQDSFSLLADSGTTLQSFDGLSEGMQKIA